MDSLESRLKYRFRRSQLLEEAMSHASLRYETKRNAMDNQRLEFLGDAVLQLVLSEMLFHKLPGEDEGLLTKLRTRLVSEPALARVARTLKLGESLLLGRSEETNGGRERSSTLADAMEAVIGAVFLDGGIEAARSFILGAMNSEIQSVLDSPVEVNPKGQLQEIIQGFGVEPPSYQTIGSEGPDHMKKFCCAVSFQGRELGRGEGMNKKDAEAEAARMALEGPALKEVVRALKRYRGTTRG